jgi:hypothetical protein
MIFADIFTIMVELVYKNTMEGLPAEVKLVMAIAAIITNVPDFNDLFFKSIAL